MQFTVQQIAGLLGGVVKGDSELIISRLDKIQEGQKGGIAFLSNMKYENYIYTTRASAVIVDQSFKPQKEITTTLICVKDAYTAFSTLLGEYKKMKDFAKNGIEQPSFIAEEVSYGDDLYLGAFSYIGKGTSLGDQVKIHPQCYIGENVKIGSHTIIFPGVKIYPDTVIGNNCTIHSGTVIGSDGFGFAPQEDGSYKTIPQVGNVIIEDNVSIGANTVIDCATMGATLIKQGAKLDNLIQVAHNVVIGQHTVIAAQTGISGSTELGDNCMVGGQVGFAGHLKIANGTSFGAQSGVGKDIKEEGQVHQGSPSLLLRDYLRSSVIYRKLPEIYQKLTFIEKELLKLLDNSKIN